MSLLTAPPVGGYLGGMKNSETNQASMKGHVATFVKECSRFQGYAALYHLEPPMPCDRVSGGTTAYVVVSSIVAAPDTGRPETFIFPAAASGKVLNWGELEGSFRGPGTHGKALEGAGYSLAPQDEHCGSQATMNSCVPPETT